MDAVFPYRAMAEMRAGEEREAAVPFFLSIVTDTTTFVNFLIWDDD
jgi:hypothetical protein